MSGTANPLEITWTAVALLGLGFTLWKLLDDWRNWQAIRLAIRLGRAVRGGPRWWLSLASLGSSAGQSVVWSGFLAIGVIAMRAAPPLTPDRQAASEASGWVLIAMELVLAVVQGWQIYARSQMRGMRIPPNAQQAQTDRIEAITTDTNQRLRKGDIGRDDAAIVNRAQGDRIETTGEDTNVRVRGQEKDERADTP